MIELRLKRGETFGVGIDRLLNFAEDRFDPLEPLLDRTVATGAIPFTLVVRTRRRSRRGVPATHGRGF